MQDSLKIKETDNVPLSRTGRIKEIKRLSNKKKSNFLPQIGAEFQLGPYVFRVSAKNIGKMRFSAELHDVIIKGINDEPPVIDPT